MSDPIQDRDEAIRQAEGGFCHLVMLAMLDLWPGVRACHVVESGRGEGRLPLHCLVYRADAPDTVIDIRGERTADELIADWGRARLPGGEGKTYARPVELIRDDDLAWFDDIVARGYMSRPTRAEAELAAAIVERWVAPVLKA